MVSGLGLAEALLVPLPVKIPHVAHVQSIGGRLGVSRVAGASGAVPVPTPAQSPGTTPMAFHPVEFF